MLNYRLYGNRRLERAAERILPLVGAESKVLDIGCGIGMVTSKIAGRARRGHVWGIDLGRENIWYASQTIRNRNLTFLEADVVADFEAVRKQLAAKMDVVTMVDVIEHIPARARPDLLVKIRTLCSDDALMILTYPSPQYQEYLREHDPNELQIIDNVVLIEELINEARTAGFSLKHYSLETVWMRNQYVHCVFQTVASIVPTSHGSRQRIRIISDLGSAFKKFVLVPYRRHKYITRVFANRNDLRIKKPIP
jgi:2-polyprenyl-3-methyl-5-hydroxy-6-metoxy-1,4-benzoquinol methylase